MNNGIKENSEKLRKVNTKLIKLKDRWILDRIKVKYTETEAKFEIVCFCS